MSAYWIVFASILLLNAMAASVIAILLTRRPSAPGLSSIIFMLVALAVWSFGYAMITLAPSLEVKRFWLRIENIGILFTPVFWLLFTIQYTQSNKWNYKWIGVLFFIIPLITLLFIFSDRWFHLYYSAIKPVSESGGPLVIERGPWYLFATIHAYLLNLIGMGLLIWRAVQYRNIYRRQMFAMIGAVSIPILANIFYQLSPSLGFSFLHVDLTPISFTLSAVLIAFGIFNLHIFDLIPIARHTVMEHIPELVFVVDVHNRIVDANNVGLKWLGKSPNEIIGQNAMNIFRDWNQLIRSFSTTNEVNEVVQVIGNLPGTLEIIISPVHDSFNNLQGHVIVGHDISEHKKLEDALRTQLSENESLRSLLQEQAIRDPLTNVYNRRFLAELLDKEIPRAKREEKPVSIVILDVDSFKNFNDTYGHKCGDVMLQFTAQFLVDNTRHEDVVCRYGGEEFIVLLSNTTLESAYERAESWRQMFEATIFEYEELKLQATFSAGVASFPLHGMDAESVLQAADRALYQSKNTGRNHVTMYENKT